MKNTFYSLIFLFLFQSCNYFLNNIERTKSFYFNNTKELNSLVNNLSKIDSSFIIGYYDNDEFELILPTTDKIVFRLEELYNANSNYRLLVLLKNYKIDLNIFTNICESLKKLNLRYVKYNNRYSIDFSIFEGIGLEYRQNAQLTDYNKDRFITSDWFYFTN